MDLKRLLILSGFLAVSGISFCQESYKDTLSVTLQRVDSIFISQNLTLLSEKCNIESSKALIIQARLFKNINFSISQNVHNPYYETMGGKQWFDFTDKGETEIAVQKLFLVAGKRNKQIGLAQSGALKEEQYYFDLLRTLKFSLHSQFSNIYYLGQIIRVYEREISSLNKLSLVFQAEEGKGFISKKEVLRIKASLFSLENEKLGYITQMISAQTELNTLLHTTNLFYLPAWIPDSSYTNSPESFKLQDLVDTAYMYRYDLKMARTDLDISNLNLSYQKALAIPDVTVSGGWDKNGGYFHNYNYVGLSFDLPLFDRNQGNIKSAKFNAESNRYKVETAGDQVKADVINAVSAAIETNRLYFRFDKAFLSDLKNMNEEMLKNFEKRNISLIEFLDYYDAYKTNAIQLNTIMYNRINSFENINFAVGKDIMTRIKTPPDKMNRIFLITSLMLLVLSCSRHSNKVTGTADTKFCIPDSLSGQIRFDTVKTKQVYNELKLIGKVTFDQDKVVRIYPLVSGIVTDVKVTLGSYVKKGQVLAVIRSSEMAGAENDYNSARATLAVSEKNFAADSDLYKSGIVSDKEFTAALNDLEKARSEFKRANTVLSVYGSGSQSDYIIKAPVSGFVVEKFINSNMQIRPDNSTNLFTLSDLSKVWIIANVYESDISSISENEKVEVRTISYPGKIFQGKIDKVYNVLDPDNKTMKVQIQLDNSDYLLKPEMFAAATVYQVTKERMLAVPASAVIFDRNQYWVMVYRNKCDIETRNLNIVSSNPTDSYVRSGVSEGEIVIVNRQLLIYNAMNQ